MLSANERAASAFVAHRLHIIRLKRRLTIEEMAAKVGFGPDAYRRRERGQQVIGIEFLLRCCFALNLDIRQLWFPQGESPAVADSEVIRELLIGWSIAEQPITLKQVVQACAEAFGIAPAAIRNGLRHRKVCQTRAAASIIVTETPHLHLSDLAPLVGRSRRTLWWIRQQAQKAGPEIWAKVEAIRAEIEAL